ncbi:MULTISPECIES: cell division topological specificity factor MinE [Caloramator]|uniref:Cell division topological specificity factor n=1 Tax=Caloramator australicus RC3 TaxID=857293 RepID=G0V427_9CLOT|nr:MULTISPECIES: cell division topological specificity factor MinE [Caloramator]MDO6355343.1 cell division topological specificity factor MinE [Caloramator sp. CAR-1]WDU83919.1 cell division topological specificity factor MinE [Caloramator sp. Dgby_cultured_2]CCC57867.1 Cell division topological specificity factor MinE [Caloramator australicus RC3]
MDFLKLFSKEPPSKDVAKERLKLILIHDRANVSPTFLEMLKSDIIRVISDYAEIDERGLEIKLTKAGEEGISTPALIANIPIRKMKDTAK